MRTRLFKLLMPTLVVLALLLSGALPAIAGPGKAPARYIVVIKPGVDASAVARGHEVAVSHIYTHALNGFAAPLSPAQLQALAADPRVAYVEADQEVHLFEQEIPTGIKRIFAPGNTNITIDGNDDLRIDVDVAVIDTGIDYDHPDLNVVARTDCSGGSPFQGRCKDNSGDDGHGHGTHVAGTIGAIDNSIGVVGVAPGARLWAVKVLRNDGSGYISWVIAGIDWVTARADQIEVANMSLGFEGSSSALNEAITYSVAAGVVHAVAAGNNDKDASTFSPANHPDVITVSALADFNGEPGGLGSPTCRDDQDDTLADFSNWGSLIEVTAPGVCILSTWKEGGYNTISGTSMASPHVAGAAALLASGANDPKSKADVDAIIQTIIDTGNSDWTDDSGDGIQEPLLDVSNSTAFTPATVPGSSAPAEPVTDIAITAVSAPSSVVQGDIVSVDVTVKNVGNQDVAADITVTLTDDTDSVTIGTQTISGGLAVGASTTLTFSWDTSSASLGDHTLTASHDFADDNASNDSKSTTVTVTEPGATMHVGDLDGSKALKGKSGRWEVSVTVTIHDADHNLVANATVTGEWSGATTGTVSGTTGSDGTVTFSTGNMSGGDSVTFTVTGVTHDTLTYDDTANHDPDGDSDGTSITVYKS